MARSVSTIKQEMIDYKNSQSSLDNLNSTSQTAIWNLLFYVVAVAIYTFEVLLDLFKTEVETTVAQAVPNTASWFQAKVLEFQYGDNITLQNFVPIYDPVNTDNQIITRCSIKETVNGLIQVKVAKGTVLEPLTSLEQSALKSYLKTIAYAGAKINVISQDADKVYIAADIYFDAEYILADLKTNVFAAINNYLNNIEFDGTFRKSKLEDAIQSVTGIIDVNIIDIKIRDYATSFSLSNPSVSVFTEIAAGYVEEEDTVGYTFTDTINFVSNV